MDYEMKCVCVDQNSHVVRTCKSDYLQQLGEIFLAAVTCCLEVDVFSY